MPVIPSDFKNAIVGSVSMALCEKVAKLFTTLPTLVYNAIAYEFNEDGSFTAEYKAAICALDCSTDSGGDNPINPNMPAPNGISATDGTYSDKVRVTWNAVTPPTGIDAVTQYKVYRATSNVTNPNSATLIATVDAPTVQYDDTSAVQGTTYNYWIKATNGSQESNYGGPDVGHSASAETTLTAISDLVASQGFSNTNDGLIYLWWTPPTGATRYDLYRNTANDFATATKFASDVVPTVANISTAADHAYDNVDAVVYFHTPPAGNAKYYFWVVAKKDAPPAVSAESNAAQGWVNMTVEEATLEIGALTNGDSYVVPGGVVRMKMVVYGQGGGGAGAGTVYGGGGGGGAPACSIDFAVSGGDTIDLVTSPNQDTTGNAAAAGNGTNGADVIVKLNGVAVLTITGGTGGQYSFGGSGAGGAVGSAAGTALQTAWPCLAGRPAVGTAGGRGGASFPGASLAAAHYNGFAAFTSWEGNASEFSGNGGGGSYAEPGVPGSPDAVGGYGSGASATFAALLA